MPAQAGTQFFAIRCEIRWVPACAGMTEANCPWFKSGNYFEHVPKFFPLHSGKLRFAEQIAEITESFAEDVESQSKLSASSAFFTSGVVCFCRV
jgi:hypothetical protein